MWAGASHALLTGRRSQARIPNITRASLLASAAHNQKGSHRSSFRGGARAAPCARLRGPKPDPHPAVMCAQKCGPGNLGREGVSALDETFGPGAVMAAAGDVLQPTRARNRPSTGDIRMASLHAA